MTTKIITKRSPNTKDSMKVDDVVQSNKSNGKVLLTDIYFDILEDYQKRYPKCALLMQVGSFFEVYESCDHRRGNATEIASVLEITLTKKDSRYDNANYMAGFPAFAISKHTHKLIQNNYTVVLSEQKDHDQNSNSSSALKSKKFQKDRPITRVISKGTDLEHNNIRNNIISLYIEQYGKNIYSFGIAVIDITLSNKISVYEAHSTKNDSSYSIDCLIEFIIQCQPVEMLVITSDIAHANVLKNFNLMCPIYHANIQNISGKISDYSTEITHALFGLKQYLEEHFLPHENIPIQPYESNTHLDLTSTAISQLDLMHLYDIINFTTTNMGSRYLLNRLLFPFCDSTKINESYDSIEKLNNYASIRELLNKTPDIAKLHQKLVLTRLTYDNFFTLMNHLKRLTSLFQHHPFEQVDEIIAMLADINTQVLFLEKDFDYSRNFFRIHIHPDLDSLFGQENKSTKDIEIFTLKAIAAIKEYDKRNIDLKINGINTGIVVSNRRAQYIKKKYPDWIVMKSGENKSIISNTELIQALNAKNNHQGEITILMDKYFNSFQIEIINKYDSLINNYISYISKLDFLQSACMMKDILKLTRPMLTTERILKCENLRHLLVEKLNEHNEYIPNTINLDIKDKTGIVIYGVNGAGKSSLLKSLGLCVVMAQAGLYSPCDNMIYKPFTSIFTRIQGGDNILRSMSSFVVEATEIRALLTRSTEDSLILADEMCCSTETSSATAIVHTTLNILSERKVFFVTATHLHELSDRLKDLKNLWICHMKVKFIFDEVIYERKLYDGSGPNLYGIEIINNLDFSKDFIDRAMKFRKDSLIEDPSEIKRSHFNSKKILIKCEYCGHKPKNPTDKELETHHLNMQCEAVDKYHGTQHKDILHNLICLCRKCHMDVHSDKLKIEVLQTARGKKIVFEKVEAIE